MTTAAPYPRAEDRVVLPAWQRWGGAVLLLGSLAVLASCALPWISASETSLTGNAPPRTFTWHVWNDVLVLTPLVLFPLIRLLPASLRELSGVSSGFTRRAGIFLALCGLVSTMFFLVLFVYAAGMDFGFLPGRRVVENPEVGIAACLVGDVLLLVGALLLPATSPTTMAVRTQ